MAGVRPQSPRRQSHSQSQSQTGNAAPPLLQIRSGSGDGEGLEPPEAMVVDGNNPFSCNVCKRSYSRIDHLARHYRSHTREKPFPCPVCGKDFARADLLKRHANSHDVDEGGGKRQRKSLPPARPRVSHACTACAAAKLKCDQRKPCRRCQQKQIACEFPAARSLDRRQSQTSSLAENVGPTSNSSSNLASQAPIGQEATMENLNFPMMDGQHQLVSPTSFTEAPAQPIPPSSLELDPLMGFDESSLAEFLKEIMDNSPGAMPRNLGIDPNTQIFTPRDVLNFGVDTTFDFSDIDFGLPPMSMPYPDKPPQPMNIIGESIDHHIRSGTRTPEVRNSINLGTQAFKKSLWQWTPAQQDHGYAEQLNLSLPYQDIDSPETRLAAEVQLFDQRLDQPARDQILAMILSTCEPAVVPRVVSSFPSTELLNNLMHQFFSFQLSQTDTWIHLPTFRPNRRRPELIGIIIAAGAILSTIPVVRKLGFAIQESVRLAIPKVFENDNSTTRDLQVLQAYAMQLNIGLWSGDRRKMEMAESHAQPLVTMLRRSGHFRRVNGGSMTPELSDNDDVLENKWFQWVELESFKRLTFHVTINDSQTSMALLVPPLISYAELSVELPASRALWMAKSARDWRAQYLQNLSHFGDRLPQLTHCIYDVTPLSKARDAIDLQLTILIVLHSIWTLIWEYRQLNSVAKLHPSSNPWGGAMASTAWHQELCQLLYHFRMHASEWENGMKPEAVLIQERSLMNLHVSFEDVQLFAGKEGEEEARRVYPLLKQWAGARESRQAVWHAGQVLRAASQCPPKQLRDFYAIALYHASLAFWAYAVVSKPPKSQRLSGLSVDSSPDSSIDPVWLDGEDGPDVQRFIAVRRGTPVIRDWTRDSPHESREHYTPLTEVKAVMDIIIAILRRNRTGDDKMSPPPLVENLSQLMRDLGHAALGIRRS